MQAKIKFNPLTREVEIEGSERFVRAHLDKIQAVLSGTKKKTKPGRKAKKAAATRKPKKVKVSLKTTKAKRVKRTPKKIAAKPKKEKKVRTPRAKKVKEEPEKKPAARVKTILRKKTGSKIPKTSETAQVSPEAVIQPSEQVVRTNS